jgi:hypothetical protein
VASSVELWTVQYSIAYWMCSIITLFLLINDYLKNIIKNRFVLYLLFSNSSYTFLQRRKCKKICSYFALFFLDMPLTYKGKSNRESYSEEVLQRVLEDVRSGRLGKLAASH